jgi:phage-related protein
MSTRRGGPVDNRPEQPVRPEIVRRWLWFRNEPRGRSPAEEEFLALPAVGQAGLAAAIKRYRYGELRRGDVDSFGDGLHELRHRSQTLRFRVLFIRWGPHCVGLTAFCKKQSATPKPDLDRARDRARRWREVFGVKPED